MAREILKNARQQAGMTQQQVADLLDVGIRQYQRIEAGVSHGTFDMWDTLEDITGIHQRKLREISEMHHGKEENLMKNDKRGNGLIEEQLFDLLNTKVDFKKCCNGAFIACSDGRIYRICKNGLYKLAKINPTKSDGYVRVGYMLDGKHYSYSAHRIIAQAFLPNPDMHEIVNHKDGNRANNSVENLEWCSQKENMLHAANMHKPKYFTVLKKRRKDKKVSSNKVAREIGMMLGVYRSIENAIKEPSEEEKIKIESYFGENIEVLLMELVGGEEA